MDTHEYEIMRGCEDSHAWYDGLRRIWGSALQTYLPETAGKKIADIGCGTGANLAYASRELRRQVIGIDKEIAALLLTAQRQEGNGLVRADACRLPFSEGAFDAALLMDVIYMKGIEEKALLKEAFRVLKPEGLLLLNAAAFEFLRGEHDRAVATQHRYTAPELRASLSAAGFEILKMSYWNFFLFPAIFLVRKWKRRSSQESPAPRSDLHFFLPPVLNWMLKRLFALERFFFFTTGLPWGVSLFAVARKPAEHPAK